jgi:hypothetical protein
MAAKLKIENGGMKFKKNLCLVFQTSDQDGSHS